MKLLRNSIICSVLILLCRPAAAAPVIASILNAASLTAAPLAPGEYMSVFGSDLSVSSVNCPSAPATCNNTSVLINGVLARIVFVSPTQVQFIVPFGTAGTTAAVQVFSQGGSSATVNVTVA